MVALPAAALALWASSRLTWATETRRLPGTDATTLVDKTGADYAPLVPLAVLALAGIAATVALGGWPRRIAGVLLVAAGLTAVFSGMFAYPGSLTGGRFLAMAGGALLVIAGLTLVRRSDRMPRLGSSYETPAARKRADDSDGDMWRALSEGEDPTTHDR
jgi:hypothetical protein